jgi:tetratricopeptide (TPR) repeat protein
MDEIGGSAWTIDPRARAAMLLQAAREALLEGDPAGAVALAEELLDEEPEDVEALLVVADAAPRYGHAEVGVLAARHAGTRGVDTGAVLAAALFAACDVEAALATAEETLARDAANARAHAVRGQALQMLDRAPEAEAAFSRAAALRPDAYPPPLAVPEPAWDTHLMAALSGLDDETRDALRKVDLTFEELPRLSELRALHPPPSPTVDALLRGESIALYRKNLARGLASEDELTGRIRDALEAEARLLADEE